MILVVLALLCAATVPLTGGSLARLADIRLRGLWIPIAALAVQVAITTVIPHGSPAIHRELQIVTYAMAGLFLWLNRALPGISVLALGTFCNALAITANRGVMPASRRAEQIAGLTLRHGFNNSAPVAHPRLLFLGDIIPWPGPLPNTLSVGDVLIFTGTALLLHRWCRRPAPAGGERLTALIRLTPITDPDAYPARSA